jgi:hypothetical protein
MEVWGILGELLTEHIVFRAFPGNQTQKCDYPFARYPVGECSRKPAMVSLGSSFDRETDLVYRPGFRVARGGLWYTHIVVSRSRKVSYTISHVQAIPDPGRDIVQVWVSRRTSIPIYMEVRGILGELLTEHVVFSAFPGNQTQKCDDSFARYPVGECSRKPAMVSLGSSFDRETAWCIVLGSQLLVVDFGILTF